MILCLVNYVCYCGLQCAFGMCCIGEKLFHVEYQQQVLIVGRKECGTPAKYFAFTPKHSRIVYNVLSSSFTWQVFGIDFVWTPCHGHYQHAATMAGQQTLATNQRQFAVYMAVIPHKHWLRLVLWWYGYSTTKGRIAAFKSSAYLAQRGYSRFCVRFLVYQSPSLHFRSQFSPRRFFRSPIVYRRVFRLLPAKRHKFPPHNSSILPPDGF